VTGENKRHNILQEIERAHATLAEARVLYDSHLYAGAVSRAYYHAFHLAQALLLTEGLESKTHSGLAHLVSQHFVRTGRISPKVARYLGELEAERTAADYDAAAVYDEEIAREKLERAVQFGEAAAAIIRAAGYL